jgi:hypothetical protein
LEVVVAAPPLKNWLIAKVQVVQVVEAVAKDHFKQVKQAQPTQVVVAVAVA